MNKKKPIGVNGAAIKFYHGNLNDHRLLKGIARYIGVLLLFLSLVSCSPRGQILTLSQVDVKPFIDLDRKSVV